MKNENFEEKNKKMTRKFDIKGFFNDNKKAIGIGAIALVVVTILIVGAVLLFGKSNALPNTEEHLKNRLVELTKDFYEVKYYPNLANSKTGKPMTEEERKEFAQKFKDTGITITLDSLARMFENKDEIFNEFKNGDKVCDSANTKVIIYPKDPFTVDAYEMKTILDCGFSEDK